MGATALGWAGAALRQGELVKGQRSLGGPRESTDSRCSGAGPCAHGRAVSSAVQQVLCGAVLALSPWGFVVFGNPSPGPGPHRFWHHHTVRHTVFLCWSNLQISAEHSAGLMPAGSRNTPLGLIYSVRDRVGHS